MYMYIIEFSIFAQQTAGYQNFAVNLFIYRKFSGLVIFIRKSFIALLKAEQVVRELWK